MDVFTIEDDGDTTYNNGNIINGISSKLWVERYKEPGEFKFLCRPTRTLRSALPIGALVSHTGTTTLMRVEDREIMEDEDSEPVMTITGRELEAFFEHRVATDDEQGFDPPTGDGEARPYIITPTTPWEQCVTMIELQVKNNPDRSSFAIPHVEVGHVIDPFDELDLDDGEWWVAEKREVKRDYLYNAVIAILSEFNGGIRAYRPIPGEYAKIRFIIHKGTDRRDTVQFNYNSGDLASARYFESERNDKNAAYVASQYQGKYVVKSGASGLTGFDRKVMPISADDFHINPSDMGWLGPSAAAELDAMLKRRGKRVLGRRRHISLTEATISKSNQYKFRVDYDIGDLVYVVGNYDISQGMRVTEFAETEDESGATTGYPTLSQMVKTP